jgi:hypothetical protein
MYGGEERGTYRILMHKPVRKRPLGRPGHILENIIEIDV